MSASASTRCRPSRLSRATSRCPVDPPRSADGGRSAGLSVGCSGHSEYVRSRLCLEGCSCCLSTASCSPLRALAQSRGSVLACGEGSAVVSAQGLGPKSTPSVWWVVLGKRRDGVLGSEIRELCPIHRLSPLSLSPTPCARRVCKALLWTSTHWLSGLGASGSAPLPGVQ